MREWLDGLSEEAKLDLLEDLVTRIEHGYDVPPYAHNHLVLIWDGMLRVLEAVRDADPEVLEDPVARRALIARIK